MNECVVGMKVCNVKLKEDENDNESGIACFNQ
jgi:hypothetical protein